MMTAPADPVVDLSSGLHVLVTGSGSAPPDPADTSSPLRAAAVGLLS